MVRLIVSDIDGTLMQEGMTELSAEIFELIEELSSRDTHFAAASGRQYTNLRRLFAPVADKIDYICENGALVVCRGQVCYRKVINRAYGEMLLRKLLELDGCEPLLSGVNCCYVQPKDPAYATHMRHVVGNDVVEVEDLLSVQEDFLKIAAFFKGGVSERERQMLAELSGSLMQPVVSGWAWLDFLPADCNKGTALEVLQKQLGIEKAHTVAFGDNENDIELLKQAEEAYAMRWSNKKLMPFANRVVEHVEQEIGCLIRNICK